MRIRFWQLGVCLLLEGLVRLFLRSFLVSFTARPRFSVEMLCDLSAGAVGMEKSCCADFKQYVRSFQARKRNPNPNFLLSGYLPVGGGLPGEGVGAQKFGMHPETQWNQTFSRDIPGFLPGYPGGRPRSRRRRSFCSILVPYTQKRISCKNRSKIQRCAPAEWNLREIFRFSHRFWREILVKFSVAHPNPGKRSAENFTKISRQISRHLWQRKTEKNFTSALLQGSCSEKIGKKIRRETLPSPATQERRSACKP